MKAKEFIKKLNLSTFNGTICVSEKELERHLEEFGKRRAIDFLRYDDDIEDRRILEPYDDSYQNFLEHENNIMT